MKTCCTLVILTLIIIGCSVFDNTPINYPTIPLPPQKTNASDAIMPVNLGKVKDITTSKTVRANKDKRTIEEDRSNGQVTQIKVDNGNSMPDYYMYPSQQQNLNINSTPDKDLSTPSWQINW